MTVILRRVDAKLTNERTTIEAVNLGQSATEGERVSRSSKQRIDGHAERKERVIMPEPGIIQNLSAVGTAFTASLVECVEALTIVLAVSSVSGRRSGLLGAGCGVVLLAAIVALAGGALVGVPLNDLHVVVGVVLLVFGFSWLRKAVLRTAGIKALRDEAAIYIRQIDEMRSKLHAGLGDGPNLLAMTAALKAVLLTTYWSVGAAADWCGSGMIEAREFFQESTLVRLADTRLPDFREISPTAIYSGPNILVRDHRVRTA